MSILGSFRRPRKRKNSPAKTGGDNGPQRAPTPIEWEFGDEVPLYVQSPDIESYTPKKSDIPIRVDRVRSASRSASRNAAISDVDIYAPKPVQTPLVSDDSTFQPASYADQDADQDRYHFIESDHTDEPEELFPAAREQATPLPVGNLLTDTFRGPQAQARVQAVRAALEDALETWWSRQELLSPALLRNSLLVLEAGYVLDEAHLSLILRSALRLRKGMVTALRHQTDPDRAAYLLKEALLDAETPLPAGLLWRFQQEDEESAEWVDLLTDDLRQEVDRLSGQQRQLAKSALNQLESDEPLLQEPLLNKANAPAGLRLLPNQPILIARPQRWPIGRALLIFLFIAMLVSLALWRQQRSLLGEASLIPAGQYVLGGFQPNEPSRTVTVKAFTMDRTEVTNGAYRRCYEQGICPRLADEASATHADYFNNPVFERYPVLNIDWPSAAAYCTWAGKRLPSADEWEVAASIAPATARQFRYPWGNLYDAQLSNGKQSGVKDALQVGLHYPADASPFGLTDMIGNVAEWTSTPGRQADQGDIVTTYIVKGGSYMDEPDLLTVDSSREVVVGSVEPWLGFRCIQDQRSFVQN